MNHNPKVNITTSINNELWNHAKQNNLAWNDALSFGVEFKLAELGICEYPPTKLSSKVETLVEKLSEVSQELSDLKNDDEDVKEPEEEADEFFDEVKVAEVGE